MSADLLSAVLLTVVLVAERVGISVVGLVRVGEVPQIGVAQAIAISAETSSVSM